MGFEECVGSETWYSFHAVDCDAREGPGVATFGNCRLDDMVGQDATKADWKNRATRPKPTAPFCAGFFLLASLSYSA